ncbi:DUF805 domain-containing protein [Parasalinivibrio latis]|uniref:DUF805 domain-containing protein n=1 Tax=Parasalinivibrio latis TaxID=2952610 RepID=UPI0030E0D2B4
MKWYLQVLKNYAVLKGRARRKEYFMFLLINILAIIVLSVLDAVLGTYLLAIIYCLATLIPSFAVTVRRLHDTGRSGWWILICVIPFIGSIVYFIFTVLDSQKGSNKFGPNPKELA